MTTYTDPFSGSTIQISEVSYAALALSSNVALAWPVDSTSAGAPIAARILDVTPSGSGLSLALPDARRAANGFDMIVSNLGASVFTLTTASGATVASLSSGQSLVVYLTNNTTSDGVWRNFVLGAFTAAANAALLAGRGLAADGALLRIAPITATFSNSYGVLSSDLGKTFVWTGGAGTATLPLLASLGATFVIGFSNQGSGSLVIAAAGADVLDGAASITLQPGESFLTFAGSVGWYTVGRGRSVYFQFSLLTKGITGGAVTLSAGEASNVVQKYTGVLVSNATITLPAVVQVYYISNQTTGAFSLTFKNPAAGTTVVLPQGQQTILLSDGTNIIGANTAVAGITSLTIIPGTAASPAISFQADATTGYYQPAAGSQGWSLTGVNKMTLGAAGLTLVNGISIGTGAGDAFTFTGNAATWSGNPTHSGTHTYTNIVSCAVVPSAGGHLTNKTYVDGVAISAVLPGQSGATLGKFIYSNGTTASWQNPIGVNATPKTANYTAVASDQFIQDTSGGAFTVTLPAGSAGAPPILIHDLKGTFTSFNLTIAPNGADNIYGSNASLVCDLANFSGWLVWTGASQGWRFL
jgi:hypothetical protein